MKSLARAPTSYETTLGTQESKAWILARSSSCSPGVKESLVSFTFENRRDILMVVEFVDQSFFTKQDLDSRR